MSVKPNNSNLAPTAQPWGRWVEDELERLSNNSERNSVNIEAANAVSAGNAAATEEIINTVEEVSNGQITATTPPAAPEGVSVVTHASYWTATGEPRAEALISWQPVTVSTSGEPMDMASYSVMMSNQDIRTTTRINYIMNPRLRTMSSWVATSGVTTPTADGVQIDWATAPSSFELRQSDSIAALPGSVWNSSYNITVPVGYPALTVYVSTQQLNSSGAVVSSIAGGMTAIEPGNSLTVYGAPLTVTTGVSVRTSVMGLGVSAGSRAVFYDALLENVSAVGMYFDGNTPADGNHTYDWQDTPDASYSTQYTSADQYSTIGTVAAVPGDPAPVQELLVTSLTPGTTYAVVVTATSVFGVTGPASVPVVFTTLGAPEAALIPSDPVLDTRLGIVVAAWDGTLGGSTPPPGFVYVFGEFSREGTEDWAQFGPQLRKSGSLNLTTEPVGTTVRIRFRSVDNMGNVSDPSAEAETVVLGVTGPDIEANSVTANHIVAGTITVNELSPSVGDDLNISANDSITIIAGAVDATNDNLEAMQMVYSFTPTEAVISAPDSNFTLALDNDSIEIREGNVPVSRWDAGQMTVTSFIGETVILANHQLEKYGTGTVMRAL